MNNKELENALMNEWPDLQSLEGELPPVAPFTEELLPVSFRPMVCDAAERMSVPLDFPAIVAILTLAGTVNRRAVIEPMENDITWLVTPNLWGGLVARPGEMKSPLIDTICAPVEAIQEDWQREYDDALRDYIPLEKEYQLRLKARDQMYVARLKDPKKPDPIDLGPAPEKPILKRILINDATHEKLHEILSENPSGVLVVRDELTGWLSSLDKPGREDARGFFLQAWNGNSTFTVDRIGRGTIHASICVSMLGGIQPARLRSYLTETIKDGPGNDGLMQRFQLLVWPDPASWKGTDRTPDKAAAKRVEHALRMLVQMAPERPARFKFSPDAQELFNTWREELEIKKLRGSDDHPALIAHLSKYRSLMPSLALLFELADRSSQSSNFQVSVDHAAQAVAWCEYLESHARRIYSCITTPRVIAARELGLRIKQGCLGQQFTSRDIYRKGWTSLETPLAAEQALEFLVDSGWVRIALYQPERKTNGRPPSSLYEVNPAIWDN